MKRNYYSIFLLLIILFASCRSINLEKYSYLSLNSNKKNTDKTLLKKAPPITIWVHGTRAFFSKYFFQNFFFCMPGLNPAKKFEQKYHLRSIAQLLSTQAPDLFSFDEFYFFGWSGKLSHKARIEAAEQLYQAILKLIQKYEIKYAQKPCIRIITHSHGGNVALNMAKIKDCKNSLLIDELILLACPIQEQTVCYAEDEIFSSIYSFYSSSDTIQILDPQGFHYWRKKHTMLKPRTFFSGRCFPNNCSKVRQVEIKLNRKGLMHIDFLFHKFLKYLPDMLHTIKHWYEQTNDEKPKLLFIKTI